MPRRKKEYFVEDKHHPFHHKVKLMTKLRKNEKSVLITFKEMELSVIEMDGDGKQNIKEKVKYKLGDIGIERFCRRVRQYQSKGYEIEGEVSNLSDVIKEWAKTKEAK
jgi:hypothetical protein